MQCNSLLHLNLSNVHGFVCSLASGERVLPAKSQIWRHLFCTVPPYWPMNSDLVAPVSPALMMLGVIERDRRRVGLVVTRRMGREIADCMVVGGVGCGVTSISDGKGVTLCAIMYWVGFRYLILNNLEIVEMGEMLEMKVMKFRLFKSMTSEPCQLTIYGLMRSIHDWIASSPSTSLETAYDMTVIPLGLYSFATAGSELRQLVTMGLCRTIIGVFHGYTSQNTLIGISNQITIC